jgi:hypothetical protein
MNNINFSRNLVSFFSASAGRTSYASAKSKSSLIAASIFFAALLSVILPLPIKANSTYFNLSGGNLTYNLNSTSINLITTNNNWTNVSSVEGYCGGGLANTFGVDPQTILTTEFSGNMLPNSPTCVAANKGNPSAFNAGGLAEFDDDRNSPMGIGFQGNVQARAPYMVFYLNTVGKTNIMFRYDATDLDDGSNDSVSQVALQYRVGDTGNFINLPAGYIPDATDLYVAGATRRVTTRTVALPAAVDNQAKVQVRIMMTDAAGPDGASTPDEWVGINNVTAGNLAPTAASVNVARRVFNGRRGVARARVTLSDSSGVVRTALTNSLGYYRFTEVAVGDTYIFEAKSKQYSFAPQVLSITGDISDLNFTAP